MKNLNLSYPKNIGSKPLYMYIEALIALPMYYRKKTTLARSDSDIGGPSWGPSTSR